MIQAVWQPAERLGLPPAPARSPLNLLGPSPRFALLLLDRLSGSLPSAWAAPTAMRLLKNLLADGNALTGTLPPSWGAPGALPYLGDLRLAGNRLGGGLPEEWGQALAFPHLIEL